MRTLLSFVAVILFAPGAAANPEGSCAAFLECSAPCSPLDSECVDACLPTDDEELALAQAVQTCAKTSCGNAIGVLKLCAKVLCKDATTACLKSTGGCGFVTEAGECWYGAAVQCVDSGLVTEDCKAAGKSCSVASGTASCVESRDGQECGEITANGTCDGDIQLRCKEGVLQSFDCASLVAMICGPDGTGAFKCLKPGAPGYPCDGEPPRCQGDTLVQCINGHLVFEQCGLENPWCNTDGGAHCGTVAPPRGPDAQGGAPGDAGPRGSTGGTSGEGDSASAPDSVALEPEADAESAAGTGASGGSSRDGCAATPGPASWVAFAAWAILRIRRRPLRESGQHGSTMAPTRRPRPGRRRTVV